MLKRNALWIRISLGTLPLVVTFLAAPAVAAAKVRTQEDWSIGKARARRAARVITDRTAYVAGDAVTIHGYGFSPFENVLLQVTHADGSVETALGHAPWTAVADADGKFEAAWPMDANHLAGHEFVVKALGQDSGASGQVAFRRAAVLETEKDSYAPGETALIKGSHFAPHEAVTLAVMQRDDTGANRLYQWVVNADGGGAIASSWQMLTDAHPDSPLTLTATGSQSGLTEQILIATPPYSIDGVVPDTTGTPLPTQFVDGHEGDSELGPINSNTTKVGVIHTAPLPMLGLTNPPDKVDLFNIWLGSKKDADNHIWVYFAWQRDSKTGSGVIAIEFQKAAPPAGCDYSNLNANTCNPWANRQAGDFLLVWDQNGQTINIIKRTFTLVNGQLTLDAGVTLNATEAAAAVGSDGFRGEARVDFSAAVFGGTACQTFGNIIPGTITGNSDQADYKDTVLKPFAEFVTISNCGSVKVTKKTQPAGGTGSFPYTLARSGGEAVNFAGDTSASATLTGHNDFDLITNLIAANNYTLAEGTVSAPWQLLSITCGGVDVTAGGAFAVVEGQTTECTITNKRQQGTLTVIKHVVNDNGGTATAGQFAYSLGDGSANTFSGKESPGETFTVDAGYTFSVIEATGGPNGYSVSYSGDCSGTISDGDAKTCTITNDDQPPSLTLNKVVVNDNGGGEKESAWTLTANGGTAGTLSGPGAAGNADVVSGSSFKAGTYALSETGPAGYTAGSWSCTGTGTQQGNQIALALGQSAVCTITNNDNPAPIDLTTSQTWNLKDTATLAGFRSGATSAGTLTFLLFKDDATCTTAAVFSEDVTVTTGIVSVTNGHTTTKTGTYRWKLIYTGDQFNTGFTSACGVETTTITAIPNQP